MRAVVISYLGTGRINQEDNYFLYPDQILPLKDRTSKKQKHYLVLEKTYQSSQGVFAVADGMGGYAHGEVASEYAVKYVKKYASEWLSSASSSELILPVLQKSLNEMNHAICSQKEKYQQDKMGTTLAAVIVKERQVFGMNIGDSRIYRYNRELQLFQTTEDQNQGTKLLNMGLLSTENYTQFQYRKALYQYLGKKESKENPAAQYVKWTALDDREWLLITTDGLTDELSRIAINDVLKRHYEENDIRGAALELMEKAVISSANHHHGTDNITLILISLSSDNRKADCDLKLKNAMVTREEINMTFWDQVSRKVTEKSQEAINYGKSMADTVKLNSMISDEEKKIDALYLAIGKKYVEKYNGDFDTEFREELLQLKRSVDLIQDYKNQINVLKGTQTCEKCGAEVVRGATFCSNCGNRMPELKVEQPVENSRVCPKCGAKIQEGDMFCMGCGSKVEPVAPVSPISPDTPTVPDQSVHQEYEEQFFVTQDVQDSLYKEMEDDQPKVCGNCGESLGPEDMFCVNCGTKVNK